MTMSLLFLGSIEEIIQKARVNGLILFQFLRRRNKIIFNGVVLLDRTTQSTLRSYLSFLCIYGLFTHEPN